MVYIKKINYSHTHELSKENPAALISGLYLPTIKTLPDTIKDETKQQ